MCTILLVYVQRLTHYFLDHMEHAVCWQFQNAFYLPTNNQCAFCKKICNAEDNNNEAHPRLSRLIKPTPTDFGKR